MRVRVRVRVPHPGTAQHPASQTRPRFPKRGVRRGACAGARVPVVATNWSPGHPPPPRGQRVPTSGSVSPGVTHAAVPALGPERPEEDRARAQRRCRSGHVPLWPRLRAARLRPWVLEQDGKKHGREQAWAVRPGPTWLAESW